jgi:hypothetical protein
MIVVDASVFIDSLFSSSTWTMSPLFMRFSCFWDAWWQAGKASVFLIKLLKLLIVLWGFGAV